MSKFKLNYLRAAALLLVTAFNASAEEQPDSIKYDHNAVFGPIVWPTTTGDTRSAGGQPGQHYWQNRADYQIKATLNEVSPDTTIAGEVTVNYTNNSPDNLDYLWM